MSGSDTRRERKVVTVLFADLVGFTGRAETLDPEDVDAILRPYHERLRTELERHGGTVEKFIGDAVMAVFGAPVAHEDDPERAVRAALAIRDALSEELDLRIAVNTGEALVSLGARPDAGEGMVAGDVVNTVARLQAAAPVNGILVAEPTYRATERAIEYREASPVHAKGKAQPILTWEAVAPRARFGVDVAQHGGAELVGREVERRLLRDAFERARRESAVQIVTLVGVPGIGKSRLVWELFRELDAETDVVYWRQGRALAYGGGAFGALAEAARAVVGMLESDSPAQIEAKLDAALAGVFSDGDERRWLVGHMRPLLGLESGGGGTREESFTAWRRLFEGLAEESPLVLVLEDLHWADDGTLDFLDHLAEWASDVPMLVLCTARPELFERRPGWGGGRLNATTISLSPLSDEDTSRLLGHLLERPLVDAELQARLLRQAGGNPLYAEEYTRMVEEREEGDALPESVQGIIAARLDLLSQAEKELLQDAAVLGKVFWRGGLTALAGEAELDELLQRLTRKEFVRRERTSSVAGETELAFRHALVRDVTYGQIPRLARAEKHRRAAEWIGSTAARPDLVAHHYVAAIELADAAGLDWSELAAPARIALREAADRAYALASYDPAVELYRRVLDLSPPDGDRADVLYRLGQALYRVTLGGGREELAEARELAVAGGDTALAIRIETAFSYLEWQLGHRDAAYESLDRALELARGLGDDEALAPLLVARTRYHLVTWEIEDAVRVGDEAIALSERLGLDEPLAAALLRSGSARASLGREDGIAQLERGLEIAVRLNDSFLIQAGHSNLADVVIRARGVRAGLEHFAAARESSTRFGFLTGLRSLDATEAGAWLWLGEWERALELIGRAVETEHYHRSSALGYRSTIRYARGDDDGALADRDVAVTLARSSKDLQVLAPALAWSATLDLAHGEEQRARARALELVPVIESTGWQGYELFWPHGTLLFLELGLEAELLRADDAPAARDPWATAVIAAVEGDLPRAADVLDSLDGFFPAALVRLRAGGEQNLRRARDFFVSVAATRYVAEADELLATSRSA